MLISYYLRVFVLPLLLLMGIVLNTISVIVMRRIRTNLTSKYMALLGLVDIAVLVLGGSTLWLHSIEPSMAPTALSQITCKSVPFFLYTFADLSVFIIVIMTAERFYAVWRPINRITRRSRFKVNICVSLFICSFINCHFLFTHSLETPDVYWPSKQTLYSLDQAKNTSNSNFDHEHELFEHKPVPICIDVVWSSFYERYWLYIDASIYSFIPSILLTIFNISIIRYLFKAAEESHKLKQFKRHTFSLPKLENRGKLLSKQRSVSSMQTNIEEFKPGTVQQQQRASILTTLSALSNQLNVQEKSGKTTSFIERAAKPDQLLLSRPEILDEIEPFQPSPSPTPSESFGTKFRLDATNKKERSSNFGRRLNTRVTLMLVVLNISFCIFSMPMVILQIVYYSLTPLVLLGEQSSSMGMHIDAQSQEGMDTKIAVYELSETDKVAIKMDLLKAIAEILQYLNHSSNFFLYSLSGKTFRNETKAIWKECKKSIVDHWNNLFRKNSTNVRRSRANLFF
nr:G protein-coupled receptor [Proales similis]